MKKSINIAYFPPTKTKEQVLGANGKSLDKYCIKCKVNDKSGLLDATFKVDALDYLEEEVILKVKMDYGYEIFRISKVEKGTRYIDIVARQYTIGATLTLHLEDVRPTNRNGQSTLSYLLDNSEGVKDISVHSNISNLSTAYYQDMSMYEAIFDSDNSFLTRWGGEVQRRGYDLTINSKIGIDRGVTIREGKNLIGFSGSTNVDNLLTKVRGKGFNGIKGNWISSPLINNYARVYQKTIDYQDVKVKGESDTEGFDTEAEAIAELDRRAALEFSENDIDKIRAVYNINFVQLEKTEQYKDYVAAERVFMGDTIRVYIPKIKTDIKVRVVDRIYDVLAQKVIEVQVSNIALVQSLSTKDIISDLKKQYSVSNSVSVAQYIDTIIKSGMKNSYVTTRENEYLAMDTKDINTATVVARLNKNGLGFSTTGYYGEYTYGFTLDGKINASLIQTGILLADLIKAGILESSNGLSWVNMTTGSFNFANRLIFDGTNMSITGDFTTYDDVTGNMAIRLSKRTQYFYDHDSNGICGEIFAGKLVGDLTARGIVLGAWRNKFLMIAYQGTDNNMYPLVQVDNGVYGNPGTVSISSGQDIFTKNLYVSESKNCIQDTKTYGKRLINAYETAEYYSGDLGFGKINSEGECIVFIDPIFAECINTKQEYHAPYSVYKGKITEVDRQEDYIIFYGEPDTEFSWEIKAKRNGFEHVRLEQKYIGENGLESLEDELRAVLSSDIEEELYKDLAEELLEV